MPLNLADNCQAMDCFPITLGGDRAVSRQGVLGCGRTDLFFSRLFCGAGRQAAKPHFLFLLHGSILLYKG